MCIFNNSKNRPRLVLVLCLITLATLFVVSTCFASITPGFVYASSEVKNNSRLLNTISYQLEDNTDYVVNSNVARSYPLGGRLASIFVEIDSPSGEIQDLGTRNVNGREVDLCGIIAGGGEVSESFAVDVQMKFNKEFSTSADTDETQIIGTDYYLST
ncbi:MAG: hypothetical protein LBE09_09640, partial [Christensenellaceae bacterium]|nr:hypothetical protein [Christensenellaceae bacterium]